MLIFVVKKGVWFEEELHLDDPTLDTDVQRRGKARLWYEETGLPSDYFLVACDDPPSDYGERVKGKDRKRLMDGIAVVFERAQANMEDYGPGTSHSFYCDFAVPKAVIDGYTG